jgi:hypothetical protein
MGPKAVFAKSFIRYTIKQVQENQLQPALGHDAQTYSSYYNARNTKSQTAVWFFCPDMKESPVFDAKE